LQKILSGSARQANAFAGAFRDRLPPEDVADLEALARLPALGPLGRRIAIIRHRLWFASPLKNAAMLVLV
jgi:hypothetical protein